MTQDTGDRQQGPAASDPTVERLVAECLQKTDQHCDAVLEKACAEHPDEAAALRKRFGALRTAGLLGPWAPVSSQDAAVETGAEVPADEAVRQLELLGPYRILEELGRGGQAVVYLAEDTRLHRPVALKILTGLGPLSGTAMRRFRREAEVASRLNHPGICAVYDAGIEQGTPYIAMRYVEGVTLGTWLSRAKKNRRSGSRVRRRQPSTAGARSSTRSEVLRVLQIVEKTARALHVAHEAGIVHRDVKPGNIMLTAGDDPVLLDFGVAAGEDSGVISLTASDDRPGTLAYMSPEQLTDQPVRLDRRTDVYSLGVTLYEGLTLERPFRGDTKEALFQAIQFGAPENPRKLNPQVGRDLKAVLETALEKERDRRYQTALDFAEDLRRVRETQPVAARPPGALGRPMRWARRRPVRAALALVLVIGVPLIVGLGAYVIASWPDLEAERRKALLDRVESHLEAGYDALSQGLAPDAMRAFDQALALKPDSVEAVAGKALVFLHEGNGQGCETLLDRHGELVQACPALAGMQADALRLLGRAGEADALKGRLPEPDTPLAFFLAGSRLITGRQKPTDKVERQRMLEYFIQAVLTTSTPRLLYQCQLARAAALLQDEGWARRTARALNLNWPDSPRATHWAEYARSQVAGDDPRK